MHRRDYGDREVVVHDLESMLENARRLYELECLVLDQGALEVVPAVPAICR